MPVNIYRPARITGNSRTGVFNVDDAFCRFIKGSILIECAPDIKDFKDNIVPVDYVSSALVYLSQQQNLMGKIFHLANPKLTPIKDIYSWIRSQGYKLSEKPYQEWRMMIINNQDNPLFPYLLALPQTESEIKNIELMYYECSETAKGLADSGIVIPDVNNSLFKLYFSYLSNCGFL